MDYPLLQRYLLKAAAETSNPALQNDMIQLLHQLSSQKPGQAGQPMQQQGHPHSQEQQIQHHEDDEVMDADLSNGLPSQNHHVKGVEDLVLRNAMPELTSPEHTPNEVFAKAAPAQQTKVSMLTLMKRARHLNVKLAAYIKDIHVANLPAGVQGDVNRFIDRKVKDPVVVHYGLVVRELMDKIDPQNFKVALAHVTDEYSKLSKKELEAAKDAVYKKLKDKYILLVNDTIVDGHHFLAKAKYLGVTCSLNVLDLTPVRFQR